MDTRGRKEKKLSKQLRRRRMICLVLMALSLYFMYTIIVIRVNISREQQQLEILERRIYDQRLANDELERIVYSDGEKEYVERIAREKLGYAAIDERIFVDLAGS